MKSSEHCSSCFREEDIKDFTILYMYIAQGQGQIAPKILTAAEQFNYFNHVLQVSAISFYYPLRK